MAHIFPALVSILGLFFLANLLIIAHELGHYAVARLTGVTARRFAVGFGPRIVEWTDRRGTVWSFSMLPMGGYVSFPGDTTRPRKAAILDALRPPGWQSLQPARWRTSWLRSPSTLGFSWCRECLSSCQSPARCCQASPAAHAGFQAGDRNLAVDNRQIATFDGLRPILEGNPGRAMDFVVDRHGAVLDLHAMLDSKPAGNREVGYLGIWSRVASRQKMGPGQAIVTASERTWQVVTQTFRGIGLALSTGQGAGNFRGIVGVAHLAGQAAQAGGGTLFTLMAVLSINLALMNLLPIPVLDGGAFLFCVFEWVHGRPAPERVQDFATRGGIAVIMALFLYTTVHDLAGLGTSIGPPTLQMPLPERILTQSELIYGTYERFGG